MSRKTFDAAIEALRDAIAESEVEIESLARDADDVVFAGNDDDYQRQIDETQSEIAEMERGVRALERYEALVELAKAVRGIEGTSLFAAALSSTDPVSIAAAFAHPHVRAALEEAVGG